MCDVVDFFCFFGFIIIKMSDEGCNIKYKGFVLFIDDVFKVDLKVRWEVESRKFVFGIFVLLFLDEMWLG